MNFTNEQTLTLLTYPKSSLVMMSRDNFLARFLHEIFNIHLAYIRLHKYVYFLLHWEIAIFVGNFSAAPCT